MYTKMRKGPRKKELAKRILQQLRKHPRGIWVRKLARELKEPVMTVHKYITRQDYLGKAIKVKKLPKELGGHVMLTLKKKKK